MKLLRLLIACVCLAFVSSQAKVIEIPPADAGVTVQVLGGAPAAAGGDCPEGTYLFAWNGDHSSGTAVACKDSGNSTITGTESGTVEITGTYGESGNGLQLSGKDEGVDFTITSDDILDDQIGTAWMSVYKSTAGVCPFDASADANDYLSFRVDDTYLRTYWMGNSTQDYVTGFETIPTNTWVRVGFAWDYSGDRLAVQAVGGGWSEDTTEGLVDFNDRPTTVRLGESDSGLGGSTVYVDAVMIFGTYKAPDPGTF